MLLQSLGLWLLYVIPAGKFSCFSGCHSGPRCPNFCVCGQVQLVGFGEGAAFHYLHVLFFVLFGLGNKNALHKLQNLDPESPLMEKQSLCAAPSMIQKPCFTYKRLCGIGCGMPLGSSSWMPVWPVLMIRCTSTFMSWLMLAATEGDPTVGGLQMPVGYLEAAINGPCLS